MVELTDIVGGNPLRDSIEKKRAKAQARLDKIHEKALPFVKEIVMYDKMLVAIEDHEKEDVQRQIKFFDPADHALAPGDD